METTKITTEPNENCKDFKNILVNGKCIGTVLADDTMTPYECYEALKSNWAIDASEGIHDQQIQASLNY